MSRLTTQQPGKVPLPTNTFDSEQIPGNMMGPRCWPTSSLTEAALVANAELLQQRCTLGNSLNSYFKVECNQVNGGAKRNRVPYLKICIHK
jgi:hypothetical protein